MVCGLFLDGCCLMWRQIKNNTVRVMCDVRESLIESNNRKQNSHTAQHTSSRQAFFASLFRVLKGVAMRVGER